MSRPIEVSQMTMDWLRSTYRGTEIATGVFSFEEFTLPIRAVKTPPWPGTPLLLFLKTTNGNVKGEIERGS